MEADPSLLEVAVDKMGLGFAKSVRTPCGTCDAPVGCGKDIRSRRAHPEAVSDPAGEWPGGADDTVLDHDAIKRYQSVAALLNFTALDRPEVLYAVKELMRKMAAPTIQDEQHLKRALRFLRTMPRSVAQYKWGSVAASVEVYADADYAGCPRTRKSTLGGAILWGGKFLKAWLKTMDIWGV